MLYTFIFSLYYIMSALIISTPLKGWVSVIPPVSLIWTEIMHGAVAYILLYIIFGCGYSNKKTSIVEFKTTKRNCSVQITLCAHCFRIYLLHLLKFSLLVLFYTLSFSVKRIIRPNYTLIRNFVLPYFYTTAGERLTMIIWSNTSTKTMTQT